MHYHSTVLLNVSAKLYWLACLALSVDLTWGLGRSKDSEFTFIVPAGRTECFFQTTVRNLTMEVEYQVIAGAGLDVGFTLVSPRGELLESDYRRSDGMHMVDPTEDGDYRLCFDNSFSKLSEKMVFFEVLLGGPGGDDGGDADGDETWEDVAVESLVEYKLDDIRATMDSVYHRLEKSRQVLALLRAFEARDRYLLEDNLWRVSFWSCLNLLVLLTVAATQIYTLRRLFDDKKRVST